MKNMGFFGYHGVLEAEKALGQKFFVDMELYLDLSDAGQYDDLRKTVSYADVYDRVKAVVEGKPFDLLEALAEKLASVVFDHFELVEGVTVQIRKTEAPVSGIYDHFGVEIRRVRNA